jgi:hypothetical protein
MVLSAFEVIADTPATVVGRITRDGEPGRHARVEVTSFAPKMTRAGVALRVAMSDDSGRFTLLGLPPAEIYAIRVTFADGFYSTGPVSDVRAGDVQHVVTTIHTSMCHSNIWHEEPGRRPQQVFEWPLRERGPAVLSICE